LFLCIFRNDEQHFYWSGSGRVEEVLGFQVSSPVYYSQAALHCTALIPVLGVIPVH
jgi:hypothetical protein